MAIDSERYAAFVRDVDLVSIVLLNGSSLRGSKIPSELTLDLKIATREPALQEPDRKDFTAFLTAEVTPAGQAALAFDLNSAHNLEGYQMIATFGAHYKSSSGERFDIEGREEFVKAFAATSTVVHIWPYIRQYFATESLRMGAPSPFLAPLLLTPPSSQPDE